MLGVKCASKLKYFSPTNPINLFADRSSTAKSPKPKSLKCDCILSSDANVSSRVIRLGRNSQTLGSAFNKTNGSMSSRFQFLKISLGVLRFCISISLVFTSNFFYYAIFYIWIYFPRLADNDLGFLRHFSLALK